MKENGAVPAVLPFPAPAVPIGLPEEASEKFGEVVYGPPDLRGSLWATCHGARALFRRHSVQPLRRTKGSRAGRVFRQPIWAEYL